MERKLKNIFSRSSHYRQRKHISDSSRVPVDQTPQAHTTAPPPTGATDRVHHNGDPVPAPHVSPGREAGPVAHPENHPSVRSNSVSSPRQNSNRSSKGSFRLPREGMDQKTAEDNIADNYTAYLPVLTHDASQRSHSEDVADRNINVAPDPLDTSRHGSYTDYEDSRQIAGGFGSSHLGQYSPKSRTGSLDPTFHTGNQSARTPRSEVSMQRRRRRSGVSSEDVDVNDNAPRASDYGPRNTVNMKDHAQKAKNINMDGANEDYMEGGAVQPISNEINGLHPDTNKIVDLSHTVDVDKSTTWAPAVTHETVKPTSHEIITEEIYRTIHNHTVYHYIQPVSSLEILPTRHFILSPTTPSDLIEISESQIPPSSVPENQRWFIGTYPPPSSAPTSKFFTGERRTEPTIIDDKTYITPEGFERRETTILYPPTLEDMSRYEGLVLPIHFDEKGSAQEKRMHQFRKASVGQEEMNGNVEQKSQSRTSEKRMSIHRKPVPQSLPRDRISSSMDNEVHHDNPTQYTNEESTHTETIRKVDTDEEPRARQWPSTSSSAPQRWPSTSSSLSISTRKRNHRHSANRWIDKGPPTHAEFEKVAA